MFFVIHKILLILQIIKKNKKIIISKKFCCFFLTKYFYLTIDHFLFSTNSPNRSRSCVSTFAVGSGLITWVLCIAPIDLFYYSQSLAHEVRPYSVHDKKQINLVFSLIVVVFNCLIFFGFCF